jgi:hypothetical protein
MHAAHGRVRFNKDHCPSCAYQGRKSLLSSYFIIFSLPQYLYTDQTNVSMVAGSDITPWPTLPQ